MSPTGEQKKSCLKCFFYPQPSRAVWTFDTPKDVPPFFGAVCSGGNFSETQSGEVVGGSKKLVWRRTTKIPHVRFQPILGTLFFSSLFPPLHHKIPSHCPPPSTPPIVPVRIYFSPFLFFPPWFFSFPFPLVYANPPTVCKPRFSLVRPPVFSNHFCFSLTLPPLCNSGSGPHGP